MDNLFLVTWTTPKGETDQKYMELTSFFAHVPVGGIGYFEPSPSSEQVRCERITS